MLKACLAGLGLALSIWSCSEPLNQATVDGASVKAVTLTPMDSLNDAIQANPNDVITLVKRGRLHFQTANLPYALADVKAALAIDRNDHDAMVFMGELMILKNRSRTSKDLWQRCIEVHPESVPCRLKLAELYSIVFEYDKALQLIDEALAIDPSAALAYYLKGLIVRDHKSDTLRALAYIQKAIDLEPTYWEALDMAAHLYSLNGSPIAVGYYQRMLAINPGDGATLYKLGMFYLGQKDWNRALEIFTESVERYPNDAESLYNLGFIHLELALLKPAREYFTRCLQVNAMNYRAYYGRGFTWERGGDLSNAAADYRKALEYNPIHEASQIALRRVMDKVEQ